jgi:hypothetical protein
MGRIGLISLLAAGLFAAWCGSARAEGRPGSVEWSDGRKLAGAISLTPGKDLRLFTSTAQVSLQLAEVKEIRFKPEKEEMWEGFYFPNAGQATQVKTGEVYPIRYLQTQITLADGQAVEGHLFTTTLYVETDDATEKVVLMAKQTGANGQKLADLVYPTAIRFDAGGASAGSARIDLTQAGLKDIQPPLIFARPDLSMPPAQQTDGKSVWTVPSADPKKLLFAVEAGDGVHVAWPEAKIDPAMQQAVETGLKVMRDFYDTRTLLGCFADADAGDVYSLVMMKRVGKTVNGDGTPGDPNIIPWSLVILRWKYDPEQKKATLLNRVLLKIGRTEGNSPPPAVFKEPELFRDISGGK